MGKSTKSKSAAPGLSSFLLAQAPGKDAALDDIFASSKGATKAFEPKPKEAAPSPPARPLPSAAPSAKASRAPVQGDSNDADLSEPESDASLGDLESDSDAEDGVEEAYAARLAAERIKAMQGQKANLTAKGTKRKAEEDAEESGSGEEEELSSDEEDEEPLDIDMGSGDINDLILGSLQGPRGSNKASKKETKDKGKQSDKALKRAQETPEERDMRTIFLGNVPADCSNNKSLKKALVRHVLQNPSLVLPAGCPSPLKLDSIRFRSLAFASKVFGRKAHAAPGVVDVEEGSGLAGSGGRGRKRAREWREADGSDERGVKGGFHAKEKPKPEPEVRAGPLSDAQKRRVAFIRGELNEGKKACNAYLVIESLPEGIDVREVVQAVVAAANNSLFEGVTIHADLVRPRSAAAILAAAQMAAKPNPNLTDVPRNADTHHVSAHEAKRTLFIGGIDFAESEESVRSATEAVLTRERGDPGGRPYVQNVRIVRDAGTGLGKGFCYVELSDEQCVDELLALPPGKNLKISKRKVRLERCQTTAAAARHKARGTAARTAGVQSQGGAHVSKANSTSARPARAAAPRDPKQGRGANGKAPSAAKVAHQAQLAEALAALPQDERKKIKSMDAERLARRAQKKESKRLTERYERKTANAAKKAGGGVAGEVLGRAPRAMERARKEKKRITMQSKSSLKKKSER